MGPVNSLSLQGTEIQHRKVEAVGGMFQQKIPRAGFYLASDFGGGGEILNGKSWVRHGALCLRHFLLRSEWVESVRDRGEGGKSVASPKRVSTIIVSQI